MIIWQEAAICSYSNLQLLCVTVDTIDKDGKVYCCVHCLDASLDLCVCMCVYILCDCVQCVV